MPRLSRAAATRIAAMMLPVLGILMLLSAPARAEAPRTMLVLDGSGSMWGQIDGRSKIEIAREVMGQVLDSMPAERELGLVAYGHTREGDCSDIAALAAVGADRGAIREQITRLNPRGKTPLSDAVVFAAEQLSWRSAPATVVLVSDGIETCHADPCAVGEALEAAGADFTVHVVGFDIDDPQAISQLECLAESTGGGFYPAGNADDLYSALDQTVVVAAPDAPPPAPPVASVRLRATELENGPEIAEGLEWIVSRDGAEPEIFEFGPGGSVETTLAPGVYDITVERAATGQSESALRVAIAPGGQETVTIVFDLALSASLRLEPEATAPVNSDVLVHWEGPDREGDYVTIVPVGAPAGTYMTYAYTQKGDPLELRMPPETGDYEVRYMLGRPSRVLASVPITLTEVGATLDAPATVAAGAGFDVAWTGPGQQGDWLTVVKHEERETAFASYAYPRQTPVKLKAALEPGDYEIRYVLAGKRVIARRPITVIAVEATLSAPDTVSAGASFAVDWTGPAERGDWVTVVAPDAGDRAYTSYFYTVAKPSPGELTAPLAAGDYEIRFVQGGREILARRPITVTAVAATLSAPEAADAGKPVAVDWTGPNTTRDYVTLMQDGEPLRYGGAYFYTSSGSPGEVIMPTTPGAYEIVYLQSGKEALARIPITVRESGATLDGPASVSAGSSFEVVWTGPNAKRDFLTIVAPDARDRDSASYAYAKNGSPAELKAPLEPGAYELRYVLSGKRVIARQAVVVTDVAATLDGPVSAAPGAEIAVGWTGPGEHRDLVTLAEPGQKPNKYLSYKYARNGAPSTLKAPDAPGTYELRYVLGGKRIIARREITVGPR